MKIYLAFLIVLVGTANVVKACQSLEKCAVETRQFLHPMRRDKQGLVELKKIQARLKSIPWYHYQGHTKKMFCLQSLVNAEIASTEVFQTLEQKYDEERLDDLLNRCNPWSLNKNGSSILHKLVEKNANLCLVKHIGKFDLRYKDKQRRTAFYMAIQSGNEIAVAYFLKEFIRDILAIELKKEYGTDSSIPEAAFSGETDYLGFYTDQQNNTPIHQALECKHDAMASLLIASKLWNLNAQNKAGNTPLHVAKRYNLEKASQALLEAGVIVGIINSAGKTPFELGDESSHQKNTKTKKQTHQPADPLSQVSKKASNVLTQLNKKQRKVFAEVIKIILVPDLGLELPEEVPFDVKGALGSYLLNLALSTQNVDVIEKLLDLGCNPNGDPNQECPLIYVIKKNNPSIAKLLLEHGAKSNSVFQGETALIHAVTQNSDPEIITMLGEYGADLTIVNSQGLNALQIALISGFEELIDPLLALHFDVNALNKNYGMSAFHTAICYGYPLSFLTRLIEQHGADVNVPLILKTGEQCPLLVYVLSQKKVELLDFFLGYKATAFTYKEDGSIKDIFLPFREVIKEGDTGLVKIFLKHKANPNLVWPDGKTPLGFAVECAHRDVITLLLESGATPLTEAQVRKAIAARNAV